MKKNVLSRLVIGLGLFAGFLAACRSHLPVTTAVEATSTALPTKASTATIKLTGTPTPSQRNNTPIATAQTMSTEPPELALIKTQYASFSATCDDSDDSSYTSLSPEGNWLAIICDHDQTLRIYSKTSKKWVLQFKDFADKQFFDNGQPPRGRLYPVHWTNDEMYLYFRSTLSISAGGTCFYGGWGQGLYRLELANGAVTATLPPLMDAGLYLFSFSPSGRWLAYNSGVPTILNLQSGEEIILHEGKNVVGDFAWSPDDSMLAYSTCQPSEDYLIKKSSIRIFSLETHKSKTILEAEIENVFLRIELEEVNRLKIYDGNIYPPNYLFFDWSNEQLVTPTFTPTP
jgi:WD40 repeat protein